MKSLLTFSFLLFTFCSFSQGEANKWYFGQNAGLDFSSGTPVPIMNSRMYTDEGSSSIADEKGNLLFYSDGVVIWDRNNDTMPNGKGLMGSPSSSQSSLIIQKPGTKDIYYVFTADAAGTDTTGGHVPKGIRYSVVDMKLRNGLGNVVDSLKNKLLHEPSTEKITGIRHCNNKDVWIVTHEFGNNIFNTYLLSDKGINHVPIKSSIGPVAHLNTYDYAGQLKASVDGTRLALANLGGSLTVFDFNKSNGNITHPISFDLSTVASAYGVEFSPDGKLLYASNGSDTIQGRPNPAENNLELSKIYQYDLCLGSDSLIAKSGVLIGTCYDFAGSLQIGPDQRIYMARYGLAQIDVKYLAVISNPNTRGVTCNYINDGVSLNGKTSGLGLPNFVPYNLKSKSTPFIATSKCLDANFTSPIMQNCNKQNTILNYQWNFGEPNSLTNTSTLPNPTHSYSKKGNYEVQLILGYACGNDTLVETVTIAMPTANAGKDTTIIVGGTATTTAQGGVSYVWDNGNNTQILSVSPSKTTTYCVTVKDGNNCTDTDCMLVTVKEPAPDTTCKSAKFTFPKDTTILLGQNAMIIAGGGVSYSWNNGNTTPSFNVIPTKTTKYCVTIKDAKNCVDSACVLVTVIEPVVDPPKPDTTCKSAKFSYASDATIMLGSSATIFATGGGTYLWKTKDTTASLIVTPTTSTDYCVVVTSPKGCKDSSCIHVQVNIPVEVPEGFSPNGDGINDVWHIKNIETYVAPKVSIYNRWGQAILEEYDYSKPWDGTQEGVELPMATYYYVISLNDGKIKHHGTITLKR